ncbi:hypothetical protein [Streptomyces sp. NBC_00847]|uniref:hypothetical protein n=1 Tax=Streptomyces sp. NBC_00847 TaxID=2975850 RepID=UPI00225E5FEA|nr:hypothetical protein [Streptomyces sp. NBC_00847]MCX4885978.1 hypothetical protein [Streptomyces sp. NBC_00847]
MSGEMERHPLEQAGLGELHSNLDDLAWSFARRAAGLGPDDPPFSVYDQGLSDDQVKAARLARVAVYKHLEMLVGTSLRLDVGQALEHGASWDEVAEVLEVSRQAVAKRFGDLRRGENVAVVISRRDRVREYPDDARVRVGEVGGAEQYDSDRGIWPIGKKVRAEARYAIVAVDGTVRRIYELDPAGWREAEPNKWEFTAVRDRELDDKAIAAAYTAGELPLQPGDDCPTRVGGAYRPHWF